MSRVRELETLRNLTGSDELVNPDSIGNINPIRYRSYYFDSDMGFYYLTSRFYDPATGRFINADGYVQTGQGILDKNMFAYCLNNPVMFVDYLGNECYINEGGRSGPKCPTDRSRNCLLSQHGNDCCGIPSGSVSQIYNTGTSSAEVIAKGNIEQEKKNLSTKFRSKNTKPSVHYNQTKQAKIRLNKLSKNVDKLCKGASYVGIAVDVGAGIYDNIQKGSTTQKIIWDAGIDLGFAAGCAAACAGVLSVIPGVGTAAGAVIGFGVGLVLGVVTAEPKKRIKNMVLE